jgi:hypothetical protein
MSKEEDDLTGYVTDGLHQRSTNVPAGLRLILELGPFSNRASSVVFRVFLSRFCISMLSPRLHTYMTRFNLQQSSILRYSAAYLLDYLSRVLAVTTLGQIEFGESQ